jgi:hypothetical protein
MPIKGVALLTLPLRKFIHAPFVIYYGEKIQLCVCVCVCVCVFECVCVGGWMGGWVGGWLDTFFKSTL